MDSNICGLPVCVCKYRGFIRTLCIGYLVYPLLTHASSYSAYSQNASTSIEFAYAYYGRLIYRPSNNRTLIVPALCLPSRSVPHTNFA